MSVRSTANLLPDGLSGGRPASVNSRDFFANVAAAASSSAQTPFSETSGATQSRRASDIEQFCHNQDGYDHGLVHEHGWARV